MHSVVILFQGSIREFTEIFCVSILLLICRYINPMQECLFQAHSQGGSEVLKNCPLGKKVHNFSKKVHNFSIQVQIFSSKFLLATVY